MSFKAGDRVRVAENIAVYGGQLGDVEVVKSNASIGVKLIGQSFVKWFSNYELELVAATPPVPSAPAEQSVEILPAQLDRQRTLEAALAAVVQRGKKYGRPESNFKRIAGFMNAWLQARYGTSEHDKLPVLDEIDVAMLSLGIKQGRLAETPNHADSWIDICGYGACGAEVSGATP